MKVLVNFACALVTRCLFILVSLIAVWRVTSVKRDALYWFLTVLYVPLVLEMILTMKRRKGSDYKWFSPAILLFLVSIVPSIWILELHHQSNRSATPECQKLDVLLHTLANDTTGKLRDSLSTLSAVCANDWILALHQILLILLIVGKWLLPIGVGVTRDELSQLLLIFVGTAADILEFTSETLSDVKENNPQLVYIILAVWTWSMLQFPLHLSVLSSKPENSQETAGSSFLRSHRTDLWNIVESLFIQDGPFLLDYTSSRAGE
ncbi:transmembrane protein 26 isoform X3 [Scleropages formosus]|uniref:transmembrane protein 26 isoform X3 n=1 Tax=Scleropages formosus TaxID=113540 RepID=UPI000878CE2F|nr:transmembrane protein 26 isoform X3 [Scleropages formosus]